MKWKMVDFFFPYTIELKPTLHPPPSTNPPPFFFILPPLKKKKRKEREEIRPPYHRFREPRLKQRNAIISSICCSGENLYSYIRFRYSCSLVITALQASQLTCGIRTQVKWSSVFFSTENADSSTHIQPSGGYCT